MEFEGVYRECKVKSLFQEEVDSIFLITFQVLYTHLRNIIIWGTHRIEENSKSYTTCVTAYKNGARKD